MSGQLNRFYIHGLWGEKDVDLRFENNRLIMVGENGSGKTTILRIIYETLACKWALLSVEDFVCIELWFGACNNPIIIKKMRIQSAKELFINSNSDIIQELPPIVRRTLIERSHISGHNISYDQIVDTLDEYGYSDREIYCRIKEKVDSVEKKYLVEYSQAIKEKLGCNVIYLPTYRRVEKRIGYVNERDYPRMRDGYSYKRYGREVWEDSIEIAKTGMDDVEYFIHLSLDEIRRKADISASRLNYQCFKGILSRASDKAVYVKEILSNEEIEKVFGSINEDVLSPKESEQIKEKLIKMNSTTAPKQQSYEQIVYYFYSLLHERYKQLKNDEKTILGFFDACNAYLGNKQFVYNEKEYTYSICVKDGDKIREIDLEHLSSGEKQVVSIFSYLCLSPLSKSLVLIDEPELSLSVPWQRKFLLDISKGQQCAGVISVTHSPFVFDNELKRYAHALEEFIM